MHSWIRSLFAGPVIRPFRKAPFRARPTLEALEDRWVPSIVVNNATDIPVVGKTDLRQAIAQANAAGGNQTITFDPVVFASAQTITLNGTQLELTDTTGTETITGPAAGVTVSGNNASRVFQVDASVTAFISGMTISGGKSGSSNGGGLFNSGSLTLTDVTISGNSARRGGGLWNSGTAALTNCTVSGNSASNFFGGGLYNAFNSTVTLTNCTVSGNSAGSVGAGLFNRGTATLTNTIVAGNTGRSDFFGSHSGTNNLIGGNPLLAPLGNYGGPTQTMALLPGSPAIDAGTSTGAPALDQRGVGRVGAVDIGAFESRGFTLTLVAGSTPQTANIGTAFANPLAVTVTANNPIEPVNGGVVSFVANRVNGATAILTAPSAVIAGGQAAVTAAPNNALGSYTVVASATGASSVSFALTNAGTPFAALVVNTTSDALFPGAGLLSLREAVTFANLDSLGISTITFDPTVFATRKTITETGIQLELSNTSETETITGPAAGVTVSGGGLSRVFQVDATVTASISGLTVSGGNAGNSGGGGLFNLGNLTLTHDTVSGNSAGSFDGGGGVSNYGTATLTDCTVSDNSSKGDAGGMYNQFGSTATLTNCTFSGDTAHGGFGGGGVYNNGTITMTGCTVTGSTASFNGGGVYINDGNATLTNCTISGNSASNSGGGVDFFSGSTTLTNCTISGNSASNNGGGVFNYFESFTLTNCTVSSNSATSGSGGGLYNFYGTATLTNCTVSGNSATNGSGGGVDNGTYGQTTLTTCFVSHNSANIGGGIANQGTTTVTHSIVERNSANVGAGMANQGTLNVASSIITANQAASKGGGISTTGGSATITDSTINGNFVFAPGGTALGGGIDCENSVLSLTNCSVSVNQTYGATALGGGIYALNSTVDIEQCTVLGNRANGTVLGEGGGIFDPNSVLNLVGSTVTGNHATTAFDDIGP
jgi:parallel beta-helix repeat protein